MKGEKQARPRSLVPSPAKSEISFDEEEGGVPLRRDGDKLEEADSAETEEDLIIFDDEELYKAEGTEKILSRVETAVEQISLVEVDEAKKEKGDKVPSKDEPPIEGTSVGQEEDGKKEKGEEKRRPKCRFHPGTVVNKVSNPPSHPRIDLTRYQHFTCCNKFLYTPGCVERENHIIRTYQPGELEATWQMYETPTTRTHWTRRAVALDCEMGIACTGESELIRVSLIDYFSGEVLLDSLVYPTIPMLHFSTKYSGVTRGMIEHARQRGHCIRGRDQARQLLWRYINSETLVVLHGGKGDLLALRWIHPAVIDTYMVESSRKDGSEKRSLKYLAEAILGVAIQRGAGHDSVEDAMACRGLVHWYVGNGR